MPLTFSRKRSSPKLKLLEGCHWAIVKNDQTLQLPFSRAQIGIWRLITTHSFIN